MRWNLRSGDGMEAHRLAAEAGISPTLARLLLRRGVASAEEAQRFLLPSLSHLHSPYAMPLMA